MAQGELSEHTTVSNRKQRHQDRQAGTKNSRTDHARRGSDYPATSVQPILGRRAGQTPAISFTSDQMPYWVTAFRMRPTTAFR